MDQEWFVGIRVGQQDVLGYHGFGFIETLRMGASPLFLEVFARNLG